MGDVQHTQIYLVMDATQDMDIYGKWKELVEKRRIPFTIRSNFDCWFERSFRSSQNMTISEEVQATAQTEEEKLYSIFVQEVQQKIAQSKQEDNKFGWLDMDTMWKEIKEKFTETEWVKCAIECVKEENGLLDAIKAEETSADVKLIQKIDDVEQQLQITRKCLDDFRLAQDQVEALEKETEGFNFKHAGLETLPEEKRPNGYGEPYLIMLKAQIEKNLKDIQKKRESVRRYVDKLVPAYQTIFATIKELVEQLLIDVAEWQDQFKFNYAELHATAELERVAPSCGRVGRGIEILLNQFATLKELLCHSFPDNATAIDSLWFEVIEVQYYFFHRTFVVTDQTGYVVKVDKKCLPTVTVRILAADLLEKRLDKVKLSAHFIEEEEVNTCYNQEQGLNISMVKEREKKLKSNEMHFSKDKKKCEAVLKGLTFSHAFERAQNTNKLVHEEKYRFVIFTKIDQIEYTTLSLPMVVTTGANQVCCALASVMWQCWSTNVFQIPIEQTKAQLPWKDVAKMLNAKFARLCQTRPLTEQNLVHLRTRLCFDDNASDETEVSLKQFCFDKMVRRDSDDSSFSFWKWFLACYNLIDKFLIEYWKDNLIIGFFGKLEAETLLLETPQGKMGTFLLRFSDSNITNSQGVSTMFGIITASVLQVSGDGNKKVAHIPVAKHATLKDKNLANIVQATKNKNNQSLLRFLYPGKKRREDLFDKYCSKGTIVDGYSTVIDAFIVELEQCLNSIEIPAEKLRSTSLDSGYDAASPASLQGLGIKRRREDKDDKSTPTLRAMLSQDSRGYMKRSPGHQMDSLSSPAYSPAYSPYHVPSPEPSAQAMGQNQIVSVSSDMKQLLLFPSAPSQSPFVSGQAGINAISSCLTTAAMPLASNSSMSGYAGQPGLGMSSIPTVVNEAQNYSRQINVPVTSNEVVIQQPMLTGPSAAASSMIGGPMSGAIHYPPSMPVVTAVEDVSMAPPATLTGVSSELENSMKQVVLDPNNRDTARVLYDCLREMFKSEDTTAPFSPKSPESLHGQLQTDNMPDDIVTSTVTSAGSGMTLDDHTFHEVQEIDSGSLNINMFDQFSDDQILG